MELLEELQRLESGAYMRGCVVNRWFNTQPDPEKIKSSITTIITKKLASAQRTFTSIRDNAVANGLPVPFSLTTFKYHLNGHCSCKDI